MVLKILWCKIPQFCAQIVLSAQCEVYGVLFTEIMLVETEVFNVSRL